MYSPPLFYEIWWFGGEGITKRILKHDVGVVIKGSSKVVRWRTEEMEI